MSADTVALADGGLDVAMGASPPPAVEWFNGWPWRLFIVVGLALLCATHPARAESSQYPGVSQTLLADLRYAANNIEADVEDIATSPLHVGDLFAEDGLLRQPKTYYTLVGAGAALGGAFALDSTVRAHLRHMPSGVANGLQDSGGPIIAASGALLYAYGLYGDDADARQHAMTGGEGALLAGLVTTGLKPIFGRRRPRDDRGAFRFFDHGSSFVSGHATPAFAGAAAVSEYFDNDWYVLVPEYAVAFATGFGRIGNDAHWLSDIIGAGLVGVGTTELLLHLHTQHAEHPSRFRICPEVSRESATLVVATEW